MIEAPAWNLDSRTSHLRLNNLFSNSYQYRSQSFCRLALRVPHPSPFGLAYPRGQEHLSLVLYPGAKSTCPLCFIPVPCALSSGFARAPVSAACLHLDQIKIVTAPASVPSWLPIQEINLMTPFVILNVLFVMLNVLGYSAVRYLTDERWDSRR
jgi:hypothetical protein